MALIVELEKQQKALDRFKTTLDHTPDCVFIFDPKSLQFTYVNHGAMEQVGYSENELLGMTPVDIKSEFSEARFRAWIKPLVAGRKSSLTLDTAHQHKNGALIPVEVVLQYIAPANEEPRLLAERNMELETSNRKLQAAQTQLLQAEKMASIGVLAAGVAHEINNPVGYVSSNMGALKRYIEDLFHLADAYRNVEAHLPPGAALDLLLETRRKVDVEFLKQDIESLFAESQEGVSRVRKIVQDLKDFSHVDESEWQHADMHKGLDSRERAKPGAGFQNYGEVKGRNSGFYVLFQQFWNEKSVAPSFQPPVWRALRGDQRDTGAPPDAADLAGPGGRRAVGRHVGSGAGTINAPALASHVGRPNPNASGADVIFGRQYFLISAINAMTQNPAPA